MVPPSQPSRTPLGAFNVLDPKELQKLRDAQAHFGYEEYPNPASASGTSYVVHPLSLEDTESIPEAALRALKEHLRGTLKKYGGGLCVDIRTGGPEIFPLLRLRTLAAVSWRLRQLAERGSPTEREHEEDAAIIYDNWHVDEEGDVVDHNGMKRFDPEGNRL